MIMEAESQEIQHFYMTTWKQDIASSHMVSLSDVCEI